MRDICNSVKRKPDCIITNTSQQSSFIDSSNAHIRIRLNSEDKITSKIYDQLFSIVGDADNVVVTLHGWMKIIPAGVCNKWVMYNGHPGDIVKFPQLKGKDPQLKAYNLKLKFSGSVIHRVTPEVDGGEIVARNTCVINSNTLDTYIETLHRHSVSLWCDNIEKLLNTPHDRLT